MKILLIGKNGFLGNIIHRILSDDHEVITLSRSPDADIVTDFTDTIPLLPKVDIVVHNAGYAHRIPKTQSEIDKCFRTNVSATKKLLEALEKSNSVPASFVYISTVAIYGLDNGQNIEENHIPNPNTPYAVSKYEAEQIINEWCDMKSVNGIILRLPLVIGQFPKGNLASLHSSIKHGWYIEINQNFAKKSAVVGTDVAKLIPSLYNKKGTYNLCDGIHPSINDIAQAISFRLNTKIRFKLPLAVIKLAARIGDFAQRYDLYFPVTSSNLGKMTNDLTFSDKKARLELDWNPTSVTEWLKKNSL